MLRRLWWITVAYLTRWPLMVIVAVTLLGLAIASQAARFSKPHFTLAAPPIPRGSLTVNSLESLERVRAAAGQSRVDAVDLGSLWWSLQRPEQLDPATGRTKPQKVSRPGVEFFRQLDEFPNVRYVSVTLFDGHTGIHEIARRAELENLSIYSSLAIDLSPLASLAELHRLDLFSQLPITGLDALTTTDLETVVFQSAASDSELVALARLPKLKTLVLAFPSPDARYPLTSDGLASLARSRSLKTLYIGGYSMPPTRDLLEMARAALPALDIRPAVVESRIPAATGVLPSVLLGFAAASVIVNQFRGPFSRLAPGFGLYHGLVAAAWLLLAAFAGAYGLVLCGFPPGVALLVASSMVCLSLCGVVQATKSQLFPSSGLRHRLGGVLLSALSGGAAALVAMLWSAAAIRDASPWTLSICGLILPASLTLAVVTLRELSRWSPTESNLRRNVNSQFKRGLLFATDTREQQIDAWPRSAKFWTRWNRIERWRAGNPPFRSAQFALMMVAGWIGIMWLWSNLLSLSRGMFSIEGGRSQMLLMAGIMLGAGCLRSAVDWRTRLLSLGAESLRPCDSRDLKREWSVAFVLDLLGVALVIAAVESVGVNLGPDWDVDWTRVPLDFAVFGAAALCVTLGLSALLVIVERDWLRVTLALALLIVSVASLCVLVALQSESQWDRQISPRMVESQLWLPSLICAVGALAAWLRWMGSELDRRA